MKNLRTVKRKMRLNEWTNIIEERIQSGKTVDLWCWEHGVSRNMYYYWQRLVREAAIEDAYEKITTSEEFCENGPDPEIAVYNPPPVFAKISNPIASVMSGRTSAVTVRIGNIECEIYNGAETRIVDCVLLTLKKT